MQKGKIMEKKREAELIELAAKRILLPAGYISLDYQKNKSLLKIRFSERKVIYSKAEMKEGIIYDFDNYGELAGIELLDFFYEQTIEEINQADAEAIKQISETEQIRKEERAVRRRNRNRKITRGCCQFCGQDKHYICLQHNSHHLSKESFFKRLFRKRRYYTRKLIFTLAEKFGFVP